MKGLTDQQLLRDYAEKRSEGAFAELVRRHVALVYSAALRMVCDGHLAEDVSQAVFVALARNARTLAGRSVLSGWLHRTAQNLSANVVRLEVRRRAREQEAAAMNELLSHETEPVWSQVAPHLDAALGALSEADRDALMLRYFERKSAREMAEILATSEEAAQRRVSRAVERLRDVLAKRGVTAAAGGLAIAITANAVQAAPVGLALTISTAGALAGATLTTSTLLTATKTIVMTTLQKTLVSATIAAVLGAGIYEAHRTSTLRAQNEVLRQQQAPLLAQVEQLQTERDEVTNRLASLASEMESLKSNSGEVLRLRGEVAALRRTQAVAQPATYSAPAPSQTGTDSQASPEDIGRELGQALVSGDPTAFDKLVRLAKEEHAVFNTNSVGLDDTRRGELSNRTFAPLDAAFEVITKAATGANPMALNAISGMAQVPELRGFALRSLGALAGSGNDAALDVLLDPLKYGFPASSVSSATAALVPAARNGNQPAIDALAAVAKDANRPGLWFLAADGLNQAAGSGNPVAIDALITLRGSTNQNVQRAAISGLKLAADSQNAKAAEALRSVGNQ